MAVSKKCKELLCLFYVGLLFISGVFLIVCTVYLGYNLIQHFNFVASECIAPFILIFLLAVVHILLTWLGVKGSTKEHLFHIVLFIVITLVVILSEMAISTWTMVMWSKVPAKSLQLMTSSFQGFVKDNYDKSDWVRLQNKLQCCGINNVSDYSTIGSPSGSIPISCCNSSGDTVCITIFQEGCKDPLIKYVKKLLLEMALVGFCSGLFQILGIVAFYYFRKAVKQDMAARNVARRASRMQEVNPLNRQSLRAEANGSVGKPNSGTAA